MNNKNLTPLKYHKANILALLVCFGTIIITMFIGSNNIWARVPIWVTGIFAVLFFCRYKEINPTEEYQEIINKGTSRAFWYVVYFNVMLNPLMQIPNMANEISTYPDFLKNYVLMQLGIVILIREIVLLTSCKKNHIE